MSDAFGYLAGLKVKEDDTAEMDLYGIELPNGEVPVLIGRHGGETNKPYANAIVKNSVQQQKIVRAGKMNVAMLQRNRDEDRLLYSKHVITGWRGVCDASGKEVPFSQESCHHFFQALPDDIFDSVREFFGNPANFRQGIDPEDAADKGKI